MFTLSLYMYMRTYRIDEKGNNGCMVSFGITLEIPDEVDNFSNY